MANFHYELLSYQQLNALWLRYNFLRGQACLSGDAKGEKRYSRLMSKLQKEMNKNVARKIREDKKQRQVKFFAL